MKRWKKAAAMGLAFMLAAVCSAGCGNSSVKTESTGTTAGASEESVSAQSDGTVDKVVWFSDVDFWSPPIKWNAEEGTVMGDITEEIERENKIINDLLSLVKMDKTASDLNVKPENINELVERILKRVRPIAAVRNIEVVFESFRPVTAEVDEVKLSLAISNLVENAIKYNKEDGWVHVSLNADHKYFYVKVADSGIGIPEESIEHIFERFYRVDKSHSREIGGTGLGLAIARNAIVMHRGAVKVYSEEGTGTTFTVRVPLNYIV